MQMVFGKSRIVAQFIAERSGMQFSPATSMIGVIDDAGNLTAGIAFTGYTGFGIEMTLAGSACLLRSVRQAICDYAFGALGCRRLQITTARSNKRVRKLAPRLGFTFEGRARGYYGDEDGFVYSMLSDEAVRLGHWRPRPALNTGEGHAAEAA